MARKAVLVGINRYRIGGADLRGCVNDVKNLSAALQEFYGFKKNDLTILTDDQATKTAIEDAVKGLVVDAEPGDVVLFHYSGHGSNVPDDNGDEADERDEILCPTDLDWKKPLRDDWLRRTFDKTKKGVSLTVIMDCCHSGTATRVISPPDAERIDRYLPSPWDLVAAESGRELTGKVTTRLRGSKKSARRASDVVDAKIPEVLVTGCRDDQTSADATIGGTFNGALTYSLVETMKQAKGALTYRELHTGTLKRLKQRGFDQVPQLEGRKAAFDRRVLAPLD